MIIPKDENERRAFYADLAEKCLFSRGERATSYRAMRSAYLFGATEGRIQSLNRIQSSVDLLTSFLFAAESAKFSIVPGAAASEEYRAKVPILNRRLNEEWQDSNGDGIFGEMVPWSLVYNTTLMKLMWRDELKGVAPYFLEPHNFGVLREDTPYITRQDACIHVYYATPSDLNNRLRAHPNRDAIMAAVAKGAKPEETIPAGITKIILSQSTPQMQGYLNPNAYLPDYNPKVAEDLVEMRELWVMDDELGDYRTVTIAYPDIVIYDRKNIFMPGELPFIQLAPNHLYDYFWGASEVSKVVDLQAWRNQRISQIQDLLSKQARPPKGMIGWTGMIDETSFALNRAGGVLPIAMPNARIENFAPTLPPDLFSEIREIDQEFNDAMAIPAIVQGKGEAGVRGKGHADLLARLASGRIRRRALVVEDCLERIGTLYFKLIQRHCKKTLLDSSGESFLPSQFTEDFSVKVDAHSSSPIFVEDQIERAFALLKAGAIDQEALLDIAAPPMLDELKARLKKRQSIAAEIEKEKLAMEAAQAQAKVSAAQSKK